ncbi:MAG: N-acetylmuramoyl-L-alanine amidase [Alphaproteobacteria bacterium]|nr:N-acetylmuramoyl-L-alanine amidase [Alphaproteobacteria bacterium]
MYKKIHHPSPNFEDRPEGVLIDTIILHYTDMRNAEEALERLSDPQAKVSAHFLIHKNGNVYQLVDPYYKAWHAGESYWQGDKDLNNRSIGIELDNAGHAFGLEPFSEIQITTLINLLKDLVEVFEVPVNRIIGHSDVAPLRKQDPGELFPWFDLAEKGFGLWPQSLEPFQTSPLPPLSVSDAQQAFLKIGYECPQTGTWDENTQKVCRVFQQHFTPHEVTGQITNLTHQTLLALLQK